MSLRAAPERPFSAEFSLSGDSNEALVSVFEQVGDAKKLLWSRTVPYLGARARRFFGKIQQDILVSEDGQHVAVRFNRQTGDDNGWLFVSREKEGVRIPLGSFEELLGVRLISARGIYYPGPAGILHLVRNGRYHAWFPSPNKWITVDFKDPKLAIADAQTTQELDRWAKSRALERVRQHQPGALVALMKPLRAKAAEHLPGFQRDKQLNVGSDDELLASYAFLTVRKEPEAEKYIRGLLEMPFPESPPIYSMFDEQSVTAVLRSMDRHLGDQLWDWWNRATNGQAGLTFDSPYVFSLDSDSKQNSFAEIRGEVKLAIPAPAKFGSLRIYLIPAAVPGGEWQEAGEVLGLAIGNYGMFPQQPKIEQFQYRFTTITPGKYRLKAVWDRRPPHAPWNEKALPSPGDYESGETAPFAVAAGEVLAVPILECTNRLAGAGEYYAADETWARIAPTREDEILRGWAAAHLPPPRHLIYEAPVITNNAPEIPAFRLIRAALVDGKAGLDLEAAYILATRERWVYPNFEVRDEHGCVFKPRPVQPQWLPGQRQLLFAPRFAMRARPGAYEMIADPSPISAEMPALTNLVILPSVAKRSIEPEPLPARKTIGGTVFELLEAGRKKGPVLRVLDLSDAWVHESTEIVDSHGQTSPNFDEFCQREELFTVRATFAPLLQQSRPERTWHVPIDEWPKDGEFQALNTATNLDGVKFEIVAIGGKGSFSYRNGRVLEAVSSLRGWDDGAWPDLQSVSDFVRLKPANHRDPVHRDELIVRLPHVALRAEGLRPDHRFRLIEERDKPWRSLRDLEPGELPPTELWYLPLNRVTRAQTGGLTVELTNAVTVEFAVRVPPEEPKTASLE